MLTLQRWLFLDSVDDSNKIINRVQMFGIFVPNGTGHLPIDFLHKMKYNRFNQLKNKIPLQVEKG
jgi:hypothetical protein